MPWMSRRRRHARAFPSESPMRSPDLRIDEQSADPQRPHDQQREARQLALGVIFEADFGQHTAKNTLERRFREEDTAPEVAQLATEIVDSVVARRDTIDAQIGQIAPRYPVVQLARI